MTNTSETEALDYQDRLPTPDPDMPEPELLPSAPEVEELLYALLTGDWTGDIEELLEGLRVSTFESAMLMTSDNGLIVSDGVNEYQVTIVRRR